MSNNLAKYELFSFQPSGALELRSMTLELKIQVSALTIANVVNESECGLTGLNGLFPSVDSVTFRVNDGNLDKCKLKPIHEFK